MSKIIKFIKKRWKLLAIILVLVGGFIFLRLRKNQAKRAEFSEYQVQRQELVKTLDVSGVLDAREHVNMSFAAGGKLVYLGAKEGDWVKKWQTIATIDTRDLKNTLDKTLNLYMNERLDTEEQDENNQDRVLENADWRDVKQQQNTLENTVLDVEAVQVAISNRVMTAPFAGILVSAPTNVTGVVLPLTAAFELVNPETLIVRAQVDESDIASVRQDQEVTLNFDAFSDEDITSYVEKIAYKSTVTSGGTVFIVEVPLSGIDNLNKYRLGMNTDVYIQLEKKSDVLVLPLIALETKDGQDIVKVKDDSKEGYYEQSVELGLESDEEVEVLSGLEEGQIILFED